MYRRNVFRLAAIALSSCLLLPTSAIGQQSLKERLVGTWAYVSSTAKLPDGNPLWGTDPKGLMIFTENGRFSWQIFRSDRPKFVSKNRMQGTPDEYAATIQGSLAYFGTYSVNEADNTIITVIDGSTRVSILHGSALALPVPDESFDRAYSQYVLMNISDKRGFFREAHRALRPGGLLALSNVAAGSMGEPRYPLPWATTPATSFLTPSADMQADLVSVGFEMVMLRDASAAAVKAQTEILQRLETEGLPPLGEHIVMGDSSKEWRLNAMRSLTEGTLSLVEALVRKPA